MKAIARFAAVAIFAVGGVLAVLAYLVTSGIGADGEIHDAFGRNLVRAPFVFRMAGIELYAGFLWMIGDTIAAIAIVGIGGALWGFSKSPQGRGMS